MHLEEYEDLKERDTTQVQLTQNELAPSPTLISTLQDQSLIGFAGRTVVLPSPQNTTTPFHLTQSNGLLW